MIPLAIPNMGDLEAHWLNRCVAENWVSSAGPFVREFEEKLAALTGAASVVSISSGTLGLQHALELLDLPAGGMVVVPDWTFAASVNAIVRAGLTPLFVDIDPATWTIDPACVDAAISKYGREVVAVLAVHACGHPPDMDAVIQASAGLPVVEDAAGALGTTYRGRPAGTLGTIGVFSFNGNKIATTGGGGAVLLKDREMADLLRHVTSQARVGIEYRHNAIGTNTRMPSVNAALGIAQLERLDEFLVRKRRIAEMYDVAFSNNAQITPMPQADWANSNCWMYSAKMENEERTQSLVEQLGQEGIQVRSFWRSLSTQEPYAAYPSLPCPASLDLSGCVLSLPCSTSLSEDDQTTVIRKLKANAALSSVA